MKNQPLLFRCPKKKWIISYFFGILFTFLLELLNINNCAYNFFPM